MTDKEKEKSFDSVKFVCLILIARLNERKNRFICYQSRMNTQKKIHTLDVFPFSFSARDMIIEKVLLLFSWYVFETHRNHFDEKQFCIIIGF